MYRDTRELSSFGKQRLLYLHIPKTAGSSINFLVGSQFDGSVIATHIESKKLLGTMASCEIERKYRFISGHVPYPQFRKQLELSNWLTFATFRKPDEHVVSHIAWVRLLAEKGYEQRLKRHNSTIQEIAGYAKKLDLSNPNDIKKMIQWLEKNGYFLFHNTQTRYLCGGRAEPSITPNQVNNALNNLELLDYVGITERLEEFSLMLATILRFKVSPKHMEEKNVNDDKFGMDVTNGEFKKAIEPLIEYDHIIYMVARRKFIDSFHGFLAEVEKNQYPRFSSANLNILRRFLVYK